MVVKPVLWWKNAWLRGFGGLLLIPFELLLQIVLSIRHFCYDHRLLPSQTFGTPVLCVGSLSAGGSGKTPVAEYIAIYLDGLGIKCVVISVGYKKRSKGLIVVSDGEQLQSDVTVSGDEAYLLATAFIRSRISVPVISCPDRTTAILFAEQNFHPQWIILDDGFQDRQIIPSRTILVQDYHELRYEQRLLPIGRLRDVRSRAAGADIMVVAKAPVDFQSNVFEKDPRGLVALQYRPDLLISCFGSEALSLSFLDHKVIVAFAGLGFNESLRAMLDQLCGEHSARLEAFVEFHDHHWYTKNDLQRILSLLRNQKEEYIILTTEKDAVKIPREWVPENIHARFFALRSVIVSNGNAWIDELIGS